MNHSNNSRSDYFPSLDCCVTVLRKSFIYLFPKLPPFSSHQQPIPVFSLQTWISLPSASIFSSTSDLYSVGRKKKRVSFFIRTHEWVLVLYVEQQLCSFHFILTTPKQNVFCVTAHCEDQKSSTINGQKTKLFFFGGGGACVCGTESLMVQ